MFKLTCQLSTTSDKTPKPATSMQPISATLSMHDTSLPVQCKARKPDTCVWFPLGRQAKFICDLALR